MNACTCNFRQRLVGDGCAHCNPELAAEMKEPETLYGLDGWETLESTPDEVLDRVLTEACALPDEPFDDVVKNFEWPLRILGYRRMKVGDWTKRLAGQALETVLDLLDDEYGPDGDSTEPTPKMKAAAETFVRAVVDQYVPWMCEPNGEVVEITREQAEKYYNEELL